MRKFVDAILGGRDADALEKIDGKRAGLTRRQPFVQSHRLGDLVADGEHGIERCHRLLEDHGDLPAANAAHGIERRSEQIAAFEVRSRPPRSSPGGWISRRIESAVTDLPLPDSPTIPTTSPSPTVKLTSSTTTARSPLVREAHAQIADLEACNRSESSRPAGLRAAHFASRAKTRAHFIRVVHWNELVIGVRHRYVAGAEYDSRDLGVIVEQRSIAPERHALRFASKPVTSDADAHAFGDQWMIGRGIERRMRGELGTGRRKPSAAPSGRDRPCAEASSSNRSKSAITSSSFSPGMRRRSM